MTEEYFTISELNRLIKDVINAGFPQTLWICGEIQGFNRNKDKRHVFFELVEKDARSKGIMARVGLVIFAGTKSHIQSILQQSENAFVLKDDIEVKFACKIDFYAPHGAVRLIVESIDPVYTLGKLAQEKQKLIALLREKGTLDKNKQLDLPTVPLNIGLITSDDSAAYNDFYAELTKSRFGFSVYLRNALMQGKAAERDIVNAMKDLSRLQDLDVIVITRGGGSIADLSCFDSQAIAGSIAACRLPVLSGIGHEINTSITDLAAHTFAKTPTAIAQFLIDRVDNFLTRVNELGQTIVSLAGQMTEARKADLWQLALGLQDHTVSYLKDHSEKILRFGEVLKHKPPAALNAYRQNLNNTSDLLKRAAIARVDYEKTKLNGYRKIVDIVHPQNTMKRGFTITRTAQGKILKSVKDVDAKQITTVFFDGEINSNVI